MVCERGLEGVVGAGGVMLAALLPSSFHQAMAPVKKATKSVKAMKVMMMAKRRNYVQKTAKKRLVAEKAMKVMKKMKVMKSKKPAGNSLLQTFCLRCFTMVERIRCRAGAYVFHDYYCQECGGGPLVIVAPDFYD